MQKKKFTHIIDLQQVNLIKKIICKKTHFRGGNLIELWNYINRCDIMTEWKKRLQMQCYSVSSQSKRLWKKPI